MFRAFQKIQPEGLLYVRNMKRVHFTSSGMLELGRWGLQARNYFQCELFVLLRPKLPYKMLQLGS